MAKTITREELKGKMDRGERFHLVNVLSEHSFEHGHIPGSINIPLPELEDRAPELWDTTEDIVVYCSSTECTASPMAERLLREMGYTNVSDYTGGIEDWQEAGYPIETGSAAA